MRRLPHWLADSQAHAFDACHVGVDVGAGVSVVTRRADEHTFGVILQEPGDVTERLVAVGICRRKAMDLGRITLAAVFLVDELVVGTDTHELSSPFKRICSARSRAFDAS